MPVSLILAAAVANANAAPLPLASASPAVAANSTSVSGIVPAIQGFVSGFATNASAVTLSMDNAAIDLGKAAVVFLVIAGVLLWFTRVNKHLGKDLVEGGIFIGLFIEFVVPFLMSIHY
jgi:hypothetical protein